MSTDKFPDSLVSSPSRHFLAITPNDGTDLDQIPKALYVAAGGNITMIGADASAGASGVLFSAVPAGSVLAVRPRRILSTGTTASGIMALY